MVARSRARAYVRGQPAQLALHAGGRDRHANESVAWTETEHWRPLLLSAGCGNGWFGFAALGLAACGLIAKRIEERLLGPR
jgi:hypothetical protein